MENGKTLIAEYECNNCHAAKVGGDGSAIFNRSSSRIRNADDMLQQITRCSGSMHLDAKEQQDIGAYLNQKYYKFK
ncbi:MAG: cytochrome c [Gallionella sp.]|nr:cytochrome c [Gallionella sp.]